LVEGVIVDDDLDVQVSLDNGVAFAVAGQSLAYDLLVTNLSPGIDAGLVPVQFTSDWLQDLAWSCSGSGGGGCSGGTGAFAAQANLPAGAEVHYVVTAVVDPSFGNVDGPYDLVATAVATVADDSQPANNTAVHVDMGPRIFGDDFE